jgi:hypothetical protein
MRRCAFVVLLVIAALPAATAHAGGWATIEVDGQPVGLSAGEPWDAELLVKQHGITPLDGVTPSVQIENDAGVVRTFRARPTGRPGTYVVEVTYPTAGEWRTRLFDGFTDVFPHRLSPVTVGPASGAAPSADGLPWPQIVAIAFVALLFAGAIAACGIPQPRRRRTAVPQQYLPTP